MTLDSLEQKVRAVQPSQKLEQLMRMRPFPLAELLERYAYIVWQQAVLLETLHAAVAANKSTGNDSVLLSRLIEKIRLIADSNITTRGKATNQLQLFLTSAQQAGADVSGINSFIARMRRGEPVSGALRTISVHPTVHELIQHTYVLVRTGENHELAAAYLVSAVAADLPSHLLQLLNEPAQMAHASLEKIRYFFAQYNTLLQDLYRPSIHQLVNTMCRERPEKAQRAEEAALTVNRLLNSVILSVPE